MTTTTEILGLFKYDTLLDAELPFNIDEALNGNWDIIASAIPTKTSQLTNDSGFLTQHQSLADYVKKTDTHTISGATTFTGVTKVPASTTAGTALQLAAQSQSGNGYIKFGSGIIVQWGSVSLTGGTAKTINLPTSFAGTAYRVASGIDTTSQSGNEQNWIQIGSIKAGSFTLKRCDSGTNHWIAVGH